MNANKNHKVQALWWSGILHALTHVYQVGLIPLYLLIQADLKLTSLSAAPLLVSIMGAAYYLASYPMGILADRVSRKKLLAAGLAVNGAGFVVLAYAPDFTWAVAAVILAGLGGSLYHPAATAWIARLYPIGTGKALGRVAIGASVGFFVGPIYAGWRAVASGSWRAPALELGALGILVAALFYWLADEDAPTAASPARRRPAEKIFPTTALWCFFLGASFGFSLRDFAGGGMGSLCSLFLQQAQHFSPKSTGFALSGIYLASAISNPLFGGLSDRGRIRWTMLVLCLATIMVVIFPRVPAGWFNLTLGVFGFFLLASYPMVEAAVMESVPDSVRGRAFGIFITAGGLIGNLSHWVVGSWVTWLGPDATTPAKYYPLFDILAGMLLASLLALPCLHAIRRRERPDGDTPSTAELSHPVCDPRAP